MQKAGMGTQDQEWCGGTTGGTSDASDTADNVRSEAKGSRRYNTDTAIHDVYTFHPHIMCVGTVLASSVVLRMV